MGGIQSMMPNQVEMKLNLWFLLFCALLLQRRQSFAFESANRILPSGDLGNKCNRLNHDYLKIVAQFYESVNLISIIFVHSHETGALSTNLSSVLLESLPKGKHFLKNDSSYFEFIQLFWVIDISCTVVYKVINAESPINVELNLSSMKTDSGIIILAENIFTIDKILFPLSRYLMEIRRQKIIVMVTNTTDADFDAQANDILTKFFQRIRIINIILITPCSDGPKVP